MAEHIDGFWRDTWRKSAPASEVRRRRRADPVHRCRRGVSGVVHRSRPHLRRSQPEPAAARRRRTGSAPTCRATTSTRAPSTERGPRSPSDWARPWLVFVVGGALGALAGFYGGWVDAVVSRITDVFFGLPLLLAAIVLMQVMHHRTVWTVIAILALFGWPQVARIARGAVLEVRASDYVLAAKALGLSRVSDPAAARAAQRHRSGDCGGHHRLGCLHRHRGHVVLPRGRACRPRWCPGAATSTSAQTRLRAGSPILFYPAGALAITVLAFMMMGDALRDALDPASRAWRA